MPLFTDGPMYELNALLAIAKDRLVFPSQIEQPYLFGHFTDSPKDEPVSDKSLLEAIERLKSVAPGLYEKNKKVLTNIPPLPRNWRAVLKNRSINEQNKFRNSSRVIQRRSLEQHSSDLKNQNDETLQIKDVCDQLLDIGTRKAFEEISGVPGAGSWNGVAKVSHSTTIRTYCEMLNQNHRAAFIKAIAAYEDTIPTTHSGGPLGSTTALEFLLTRLTPKYHDSVLDWVLRNTKSYGYFSTAPNIHVWRENLKQRQERRRMSREREEARHAKAVKRKEENYKKHAVRSVAKAAVRKLEFEKIAMLSNHDRLVYVAMSTEPIDYFSPEIIPVVVDDLKLLDQQQLWSFLEKLNSVRSKGPWKKIAQRVFNSINIWSEGGNLRFRWEDGTEL